MATDNKDLVDVFIDRANGKEDPNLMVGVNGVNYLLPRGKTSKVPKVVYDEIMRSRKAQEKQDQTMSELKEAAQQPK
jgi:hypothetical protein